MAPSRGGETPRTEKGTAAVLEWTAGERVDEEVRRHEAYLAQVQRILGLPEEEVTEEEFIQQLDYYDCWPKEEAQATGRRPEGEKESGETSAWRKAKTQRRRRPKRIRGERDPAHVTGAR